MGDVRIEAVDERDSAWEESRPRFRVYLHGSGATTTGGWTATYDVTGADLLQVVDWAQRQAGSKRTYAVALVVDDEARELFHSGDGRGLVWLIGMDGNDYDPDDPVLVETQRRMLQRRRTPVGVPEADRMPRDVPPASAETMAILDAAQSPDDGPAPTGTHEK